jgi:hypothetical protein
MIGRQTALSDDRLVDAALQTLNSDDVASDRRPLPNPELIWCKAQLLRRLDSEREALAPIEIGDRIHLGMAAVAAVVFAAMAFSEILRH